MDNNIKDDKIIISDRLAELAADPNKARRCHELSGSQQKEYSQSQSSYRNIFMSDRDRILYCKSFLRLSGKTQVYSPSSGDHQRTRLTHTLEVSQIARTIAQTLHLNCDLTEAIALGHDIGHTPFGHAGEQMLHEIMSPKTTDDSQAPKSTTIYRLTDEDEINAFKPLYGFKHNLQSVRCVVEDLEAKSKKYGLDLTNYTLWGIMHHSSSQYKKDKVSTDNLIPYFYDTYMPFCYNGLDNPAWSFEAFVVAEADEIAQMHHDLEDAIRKKAMIKEKLVSILSDLKDLMDDADSETLEYLKNQKWISREYLVAKTSKIIVNTLVTNLIRASSENLDNLIKSCEAEEKPVAELFKRSYKDPEIKSAISYNVYGDNTKPSTEDKIREFQKKISKAVINTHDVQRSDSKGKYIIKNLFEAYYTNPQQLPDSALKNLFKILKEDNYALKSDKDYFNIESDELRSVISDAVNTIRSYNDKNEIDKRRDILIMRIICDYIAGMTDSFAISEYEKLYG